MKRGGVALLLAFSLAAAIGPLGIASAADERAVLTLRVNTVAKFEVTVTLRDDDVLIRRSDLDAAGIRGFTYSGANTNDLISLKGLGPALKYSVDDKALALDLTVTTDHLAVSSFNYRDQSDLSLSKPARSAFLNYSIGESSQIGANFSGEFGTRIGAGMFQSSTTFAGHGGYNSNVTQWIVDSPETDKRLSIGDVNLSTGDLGASVYLAGVEIERYFGLNPNAAETVLPGIRGSVDTPATADVYVNGTLVKQETLPPGEFDFQNLPVGSGPNNTQIVVTDAFGRQQSYSNYFYGSDQLLAPGVTDFAYGLGVPHSFYGLTPTVSGASFAGRYSAGLTPNLTVGGRLEANASVVSGGGEAVLRLHQGVLGFEAAGSTVDDSDGTAAAISYQTMSRRLSLGASLLVQSPHYATLSQPAYADRSLSDASLSVSAPTGNRSSIGLIYSALRDRDEGEQREWDLTRWATLSSTMALEFDANLTATPSGRQLGFFTTLNFIPRPNMSAFVTASEADGKEQVSASLIKSPTSDLPSLGYDAGFSSGAGSATTGYATAQYRWPYGNYFGSVDVGGAGPASMSVQLAGGIVAIDGKAFVTQPLTDSYALVDANGLAGVQVTANGMEVGRTNSSGYAIVPQLGSYFSNTVAIAPNDVPLNYTIDKISQQVVPEYRSGQILDFRMKRVLPVTGTLSVLMNGKPTIPAYGIVELRSTDTTVTSDIGDNGEFYFENISPGTYQAKIRFKGGQCNFQVQIPATQAEFLKLGTLTCKDGEGS
jgi:outer membrane usher protein